MARRRKKSTRKKAQKKIPILATLGLMGGLAEPVRFAMAGEIENALKVAVKNFTGVNPDTGNFSLADAKKGLVPLTVGVAGSTIASKAGANRRFSIPFFKI